MDATKYTSIAATLAKEVDLHALATLGPVTPTVANVGAWCGAVAVALHPCSEFVVYAGPFGMYVEWADEEGAGAENTVPGIYFAMDLPIGLLDATLRTTAPKLMATLNALHA